MTCKLFLIGAGRMAQAIAGGLVKTGVCKSSEITACDPSPAAARAFQETTGATVLAADFEPVLAGAEAVLVAVKPQYAETALAGKAPLLTGKPVISIMAGVPLEKLRSLTGTERVIRVMPNTPALVGDGCAAFACGNAVTAADRDRVKQILGAVGNARELPEKLLDAVTGLSGSGPAFVFDFIQALADGGVAEGLPRDAALDLAARTVRGAAAMVIELQTHPGVLRDQVTSPAGTTIRGVEALERGGFRAAVIDAVRQASQRSAELGKGVR